MTVTGSFVVTDGHPALSGHFPGNPIVPGVVVLDEALSVLRERAEILVDSVNRAKFAAPLPVNKTCEVRATSRGEGAFAIECIAAGTVVLSAIVHGKNTAEEK